MLRKMLIAVALALPLAIVASSHAAPDVPAGKTTSQLSPAGHPKVVFQINQAADAPSILRFVTNYLIAAPDAEVAVVGYAEVAVVGYAEVAVVGYAGGVDFMLKGAMDAAGKPYADQVKVLADKGVAFKVCNNTLKARNLTADAVVPGALVVPGSVNEIIRLQTREGYAYFRH